MRSPFSPALFVLVLGLTVVAVALIAWYIFPL